MRFIAMQGTRPKHYTQVQTEVEDNIQTDKKAINVAFKRFAARHGLTPEEVGKHPSRTMDYATDFKGKTAKIAEARQTYGDPRRVINNALRRQGFTPNLVRQESRRIKLFNP